MPDGSHHPTATHHARLTARHHRARPGQGGPDDERRQRGGRDDEGQHGHEKDRPRRDRSAVDVLGVHGQLRADGCGTRSYEVADRHRQHRFAPCSAARAKGPDPRVARHRPGLVESGRADEIRDTPGFADGNSPARLLDRAGRSCPPVRPASIQLVTVMTERSSIAAVREMDSVSSFVSLRSMQPAGRTGGILAAAPHATAQTSDSTSACSSTVCVAFSCLSGG